MTITIATITDSAWETLYNHLQTGAYALSTNNIYSAFNDELLGDVGLPSVIIYPPKDDIVNITMNCSIKKIFLTFTIEAYHKTAADLKALVDEIQNKIDTGTVVLSAAKLIRVKDEAWFKIVNYDAWKSGEKQRIHKYTIEIKFKYVGSV